MSNLSREVNIARELARTCGKIALDLQRQGHTALRPIEKSNDEGTVTEADILLNQKIVETIAQAFPNDAILAEESFQTSDRGQKNRCWFIDPIDGTRDYAQGLPSWAIHIGLADRGRPVFGLVYEPAQYRCSWATKDDAQFWSEVSGEIKAHSPTSPACSEQWRAITSKNHGDPSVDQALLSVGISSERHLKSGSTGVKLATLAHGEAEIYVHPVNKTKLWDTCAPQVILEAAGGTITDVFGNPLQYDSPSISHPHGLLATSRVTHRSIVESFAPMAKQWFQP